MSTEVLDATLESKKKRSIGMTDMQRQKALVDENIQTIFSEAGELPMYHMLRYFMGYSNELKKPSEGRHGKRTRPALLLLVAEMFGGGKSALDLATAVELFHNFTLVHDDIVDNDEVRRGQPTVWKLWGVDHAINSGDAQMLLAGRSLLQAAQIDAVYGTQAAQVLQGYFLEVCEGQYLDFELTKKRLDNDEVTKEVYFEMIRKKTAVLVGAATTAGGISAGCSQDDALLLYSYGESLGVAYQIVDDLVSGWGTMECTGKKMCGDVYEKKKTYPLLFTLENGNTKRLVELYEKEGDFTKEDVEEVVSLFNEVNAKEGTEKLAQHYIEQAQESVRKLSVDEDSKRTLTLIVEKIAKTAGTIA